MTKKIILFIGIGLSLFSGCALRDDVVALNDRIHVLEDHNRELQQKNDAVEQENEDVKSRLEEYSRSGEERDKTLTSQSAGIQATFEKINEDTRVLNGKIEETDNLLKKTIRTFQESEKNQEMRLNRVEKIINSLNAGGSDSRRESRVTSPSSDSGAGSDTGTPSAAPSGKSEEELYSLGKQALDKDNFQGARKIFQELISQYPQSRTVDNAQFWLGETYYREKLYEQAILEYQTVIEKYPNGNKTRAALLKQGFAFFNIGDKANSRLILQELVNKYPDSDEAKIAKGKLAGF